MAAFDRIIPIFKVTFVDNGVVDSFLPEFVELLPVLDYKIFAKAKPSINECKQALCIEIENRIALIKYIYEHQRDLTKNGQAQTFIGALIIQSFMSLLFCNTEELKNCDLHYFMALLVACYDLVPQFKNEVQYCFLAFLECHLNDGSWKVMLPHLTVYISSTPIFNAETLNKSLDLLLIILKAFTKDDDGLALSTFISSMIKHVRLLNQNSFSNDFIAELFDNLSRIILLQNNAKLLDQGILFALEISALTNVTYTQFASNIKLISDESKYTKFNETNESAYDVPTLSSIDDLIHSMPDQQRQIAVKLSRTSIRCNATILKCFLDFEFDDIDTFIIFLIFINKTTQKLPQCSLEFMFPNILLDSSNSMFDKTQIVPLIRALAVKTYIKMNGKMNSQKVLRNFVPLISNISQFQWLFSEFFFYGTYLIDTSKLSGAAIESFAQCISGCFMICSADRPFILESLMTDLYSFTVFCESPHFVEYIVNAAPICNSVLNIIFSDYQTYHSMRALMALLKPTMQLKVFKNIDDYFTTVKDDKKLHLFLKILQTSIVTASAETLQRFFNNPLYDHITEKVTKSNSKNVVTVYILLVFLAFKPDIISKPIINWTKVKQAIIGVPLSIEGYTSLKMVLSGCQTEFVGINNIEAAPLIDVILQSNYHDEFLAEVQAMANHNLVQKLQLLRTEIVEKSLPINIAPTDKVTMFASIADTFCDRSNFFAFLKMFNDTDSIPMLIQITKSLLVTPRSHSGPIFAFTYSTRPIEVLTDIQTFNLKARILTCGSAMKLMAFENDDDEITSVIIEKNEFKIVANRRYSTVECEIPLNKFFDLEISVTTSGLTFYANGEEIGKSMEFKLSSYNKLKLFKSVSFNDALGFINDGILAERIEIWYGADIMYLFTPLEYNGDRLLNRAALDFEAVLFDPNTSCEIGSFREIFERSHGVEFMITLFEKAKDDIELLIELVDMLSVVLSATTETQLLQMNAFSAISSFLPNYRVTQRLFDSFTKLEANILNRKLKKALYKNIFFGNVNWLREKQTASLLLRKWREISKSMPDFYSKNATFTKLIATVVEIHTTHPEWTEISDFALNLCEESILKHTKDPSLEILLRLLEETKDVDKVPTFILNIFKKISEKSEEMEKQVREIILGSRFLVASSQPNVISFIIQNFAHGDEQKLNKFLWFFLNESRFRDQTKNEEFAEVMKTFFAKSDEKSRVDFLPFITSLAYYVSDPYFEQLQSSLNNICMKPEVSKQIAQEINSFTLFFLVSFALLKSPKFVSPLVQIIGADIHKLADALGIADIVARYAEVDQYTFQNALLSALVITVFDSGTKEDKNTFVDIITNRLLYGPGHSPLAEPSSPLDGTICDMGTLLDKFVANPPPERDYEYGPKFVDGVWEDVNIAILLTDYINDEDLTQESFRLLTTLLGFVLREERNKQSQITRQLSQFANNRADLSSASFLCLECGRQREKLEHESDRFFEIFHKYTTYDTLNVEAMNIEMSEFIERLHPVSNIEEILKSIVLEPMEFAMITAPKTSMLIKFVKNKNETTLYENQRAFYRIKKSLSYDDSPYPFALKSDRKQFANRFDHQIKPIAKVSKFQSPTKINYPQSEAANFFDTSSIKEWYDFTSPCRLLRRSECIEGTIYISGAHLVVRTPYRNILKVKGNDISEVVWSWQHHHPDSVVIQLISGKTYYLRLPGQKTHSFVSSIARMGCPNAQLMMQSIPSVIAEALKLTKMWRRNLLSTFTYLHWVNQLTGRTFLDRNQYPIFPWTITKFTNAPEIREINRNPNALKNKEYEWDEFDRELTILFWKFVSNERTVSDLLFDHEIPAKIILESPNDLPSDQKPNNKEAEEHSVKIKVPPKLSETKDLSIIESSDSLKIAAEGMSESSSSEIGNENVGPNQIEVMPETLKHVFTQDQFDIVKPPKADSKSENIIPKTIEDAFKKYFEGDLDAIEMIEEYFFLPDAIPDNTVPHWANNAADFVYRNRQFLESEEISKNIPTFADMYWGVGHSEQVGARLLSLYPPQLLPNAWEAGLPGIDTFVSESGCFPQKIFDSYHPPRFPLKPVPVRYVLKIDTKGWIITASINYLEKKCRISALCQNRFIEFDRDKIRNEVSLTMNLPQETSATICFLDKMNARVAIASKSDSFLRLFDPTSPTQKQAIEFPSRVVAVSGTGLHIIVGCSDGTINLLSSEMVISKTYVPPPCYGPVVNLISNKEGGLTIAVYKDGTVVIFFTADLRVISVIRRAVKGKHKKTTFLQGLGLFSILSFADNESYAGIWTNSGRLVFSGKVSDEDYITDICGYQGSDFVPRIAASFKSGRIAVLSPIDYSIIREVHILDIGNFRLFFHDEYKMFVCIGESVVMLVPEMNIGIADEKSRYMIPLSPKGRFST